MKLILSKKDNSHTSEFENESTINKIKTMKWTEIDINHMHCLWQNFEKKTYVVVEFFANSNHINQWNFFLVNDTQKDYIPFYLCKNKLSQEKIDSLKSQVKEYFDKKKELLLQD